MLHYDVIVIGSGGGSKITRPAADLGYKVAVIEKGRLGGTCLNHGCIPSKMLIHSADVMDVIETSEQFGIETSETVTVDFEGMVKRVSAVIDGEARSIPKLYAEHKNIDLFRGHACFVDTHAVQVGKKVLTAPKIFIAVGAKPKIPDIDGLAGTPYMTYYEALRCTKLPKRLIVLGGGYIATELGYFYGMMGSKVDFIVRSEMLRQEDRDIRQEFAKEFGRRFDLHFGKVPSAIQCKRGLFHVKLGERMLTSEALLVATGIEPATADLGLEKAGIQMHQGGFVKVDDRLETNVPGVFAFGDCIGHYFFRHSANYQGEYLFKSLFQKQRRRPLAMPEVPHAVFTSPQIGSIGKREDDLRQGTYVVGKVRYAQSAMGMALKSKSGFVKLLFDRRTTRLIGAHMIGPEASNMIHMAIAYMQMHAKLDDLLGTIYIHPALPELIRNAARAAHRELVAAK